MTVIRGITLCNLVRSKLFCRLDAYTTGQLPLLVKMTAMAIEQSQCEDNHAGVKKYSPEKERPGPHRTLTLWQNAVVVGRGGLGSQTGRGKNIKAALLTMAA